MAGQLALAAASSSCCSSAAAAKLVPRRGLAGGGDHHGPPKVNMWEDPLSPSKWKEEHVGEKMVHQICQDALPFHSSKSLAIKHLRDTAFFGEILSYGSWKFSV